MHSHYALLIYISLIIEQYSSVILISLPQLFRPFLCRVVVRPQIESN